MVHRKPSIAFAIRPPYRPCKKPLSPSCTVQMSGVEDSPVPIPLLATALGTDARSVMLAYGNHIQPVMERVVSATEQLNYSSMAWALFQGCPFTWTIY